MVSLERESLSGGGVGQDVDLTLEFEHALDVYHELYPKPWICETGQLAASEKEGLTGQTAIN